MGFNSGFKGLNPRTCTLVIFALLHPDSLAINIQCGQCPYCFMYSCLPTSTCPTPAGCCFSTPTRPWSSSSPTSTFLSTASSWWLSHKVTTSSCWPKCTVLAPHFPCRHTVLVTGLLVAAWTGLHKACAVGGTTWRVLFWRLVRWTWVRACCEMKWINTTVVFEVHLTLILLMLRIWWANNARKWQMGSNLPFKGLRKYIRCK